MENDCIEQQYHDSKDLSSYLMDNGEVSFATYIDSVYKKILIISATSYFETIISQCISDYARKTSGTDKRIVTLIENKVIKRQYHTFFDWEAKNTNRFWMLWGEDTKKKVRKSLDSDERLKAGEQAFIELGYQRNLLVHQNFAEYDVNITLIELYTKYKKACEFVSFIATVLEPDYLKISITKDRCANG